MSENEKLNFDLKNIQRTVDDNFRILGFVDSIVGIKSERFQKLLQDLTASEASRIDKREQFIATLSPEEQIKELVILVHKFFSHWIEPKHSLRVALFEEKENHLQVTVSYDGMNFNCIQSPNNQHKEQFCLLLNPHEKGRFRSLACYVSRVESIYFISDTQQVQADGGSFFRFFDDDQKKRIRSCFAFRVTTKDMKPGFVDPVIIVDSDMVGLFDPEDGIKADICKKLTKRVSIRMDFEMKTKQLLDTL
jgi:hypothetical protein